MKEIITYGRSGINSTPDLVLFTAGVSGLLFTAVSAAGLTLKAGLARGGTIALPSNPIGAGLGYGDSLKVSGAGDVLLTMWGEILDPYRINGTALEVIVATPVLFAKSGTVGDAAVVANQSAWIKPGLYTDKVYSLSNVTTRAVTW